jgi:hypothetical protein
MEWFILILVLVVVITGTGGVATWILRPVDEAAKDRWHPAQFTVADLLCLFFLIQLWMTPIHAWVPAEQGPMIWLLDGFAWVASGLLWWFGVQSLSRAGVRNPWHRSIFLAIVLPVSLAGVLAVPILAILILGAMFLDDGPLPLWQAVGIEIVLIGSVYGCGLVTRWIVARASPK